MILGGGLFTVGALLEMSKLPLALIPGHVERHELFHLFVSAGFTCRWVFDYEHAVGWEPKPVAGEVC